MSLVHALLLPHPNAADLDAAASLNAAAKKAGATLRRDKVTTLLVLQSAPFAPTDAFTAPASDPRAFNILGLDKTSSAGFAFDNDIAFVDELSARAKPAGWAVKRLPQVEFDPSTMAALETIGTVELGAKVIVATLPYRAPRDLVDLGILIAAVAKQLATPLALVAVANLASRLTGPTERPEAAAFDTAVQTALRAGDVGAIVSYELTALEAAGEEAARAIAVLHGAADTAVPALSATLGAYAAPSNTGYVVATWS